MVGLLDGACRAGPFALASAKLHISTTIICRDLRSRAALLLSEKGCSFVIREGLLFCHGRVAMGLAALLASSCSFVAR